MCVVALETSPEFVTHHFGPFFTFRVVPELLVSRFSTRVNVDGIAGLGGFEEGRMGVGGE